MTLDEFKNLSNEELIKLFKDFGYSAKNINNAFGFSRNTAERLFNKRGIDRNKLIESRNNEAKEEYEKNPKICKYCGNSIPWEKRRNTYCNSSCAASENNKGVIRNVEGNIANLEKANPNIGNAKYPGELREARKSQVKHNNIIKNHEDLNIPEIDLGCCFICGQKECSSEFCKEHNFSQLIGLSYRYGLDSKLIGTIDIFNEFTRIRELVYDLYWNQGLSGQDLSERFGVPESTIISQDFDVLNIPRRSAEESVRNSLLQGKRLPPLNSKIGTQEWHTTWTGESVFLRSSYETDYANWLDENQISYSVEELRIEYYDTQQDKTRVAIPDFYLTSTNEIVEIKSDYTLDVQEMLDKFEAYKDSGYIPKLVLEGKEVDIYKIEEEVGEKRLEKIKNKNISAFKRNNDEN